MALTWIETYKRDAMVREAARRNDPDNCTACVGRGRVVRSDDFEKEGVYWDVCSECDGSGRREEA